MPAGRLFPKILPTFSLLNTFAAMTKQATPFSEGKKKLLLFPFLLFSIFAFSQNDDNTWLELWQNPGTNFYTVQQAFNSAWHEREQEMLRERRERNENGEQPRNTEEDETLDGTYFQYKRWEYFMQPRVGPDGDMSLPASTYRNFMQYLDENPAAMAQHNASIAHERSSNSWSFVGPVGAPDNSGAGRITCIRFDPANTNIIYAGTPAGGLWKSTDGGNSWNCLTDFLPVIGCSDVAIDPTNSNILYLATGDNDAGDSPSIGVLKSTDGGLTWNTTGLSFNTTQVRRICKILIDPNQPNVIYAGTSSGIYKTYDGGVNWYSLTQLSVMDMEFKPGDPSTLYAGKTAFYKSTNAGVTWSLVTTGLPASNTLTRIAIAVTPAAPDNVYVLTAQSGSNGFQAFCVSTNSGTSFAQKSNSPNILGWDVNGGDTDGQGWYDLAVAVAPYDANIVITGGVNVWRSEDMGSSWSLNAHWYGGGGAPYVHADVHDIVFEPGGVGIYFIGCDGGVFKTQTDGGSFGDISNNMCIAQIYRLGLSGSNAGTLITGHQDNGTNVKVGSSYFRGIGGDGMDCFIDQTDDNNMFGELYYGDFNRSTNGGINFQGITSGLTGSADWVTPWVQDPVDPNVLYAGYDQLFKSTNLGSSWSPTSTTMLGVLKDIAVAPSNNQYIYTTTGVGLTKSTDGGVNWSNITPSLLAGGTITRVTVSSYDERKIWISISGYTANKKVLYSSDAGLTWSNISYGLPNIPANCIVAVPNSMSDAVFVGCDAGVYYRDNSSATWQPYFQGLPNVPVFDLDIFKPTMMLRAATYGRGVWECAIDQSLLTPLADFSADLNVVCPGQTVQFTDLSTFSPNSWSWNFPGGTPSSSTQQNPAVVYNTPGTYLVTLTATNAAGSATQTQTACITVNGAVQPPYVEDFTGTSFLPAGWSGNNVGNQNAFWKHDAVVGNNNPGSAYFDNLNNNINGEQDDMRSPGLNFTGYTSLSLTFDVAYASYNTSRSDTLEVLASTDCGATWTQIYLKGGANLSTAANQTSAFTPTSSQWRNESVNVNAYANNSSVIFAFRNHGRHGNFLWLDNINITGTVNAAPNAAFSLPASACENGSVSFTDNSVPAASAWTWYFPGATTATSSAQNPTATWTTAGTYTVSLVATNSFGSDSTSMVVTVNPAPVADAGADTALCSGSFVYLQASGGINYSWSPVTNLTNPQNASTGLSLSSTQTYSVTVTDANGCAATDSVKITSKSLPNFSATANPLAICLGDTAQISTNNSNWTYSWLPATAISSTTSDTVHVWPSATTTYSVTALDTNGCTATTSKTITVYLPLLQPTVLVYGFTLTCSTYGYSYQWYLNGNPIAGATSQVYVATQVGNYSVQAFTYQGCASGESAIAFVDGMAEESGTLFNISPNPNNGAFDLAFVTTSETDYTVTIYSMDGRLVYSEALPHFSGAYNRHLDLSAYGTGTYAIRLSDEKGQTVRLVIIR